MFPAVSLKMASTFCKIIFKKLAKLYGKRKKKWNKSLDLVVVIRPYAVLTYYLINSSFKGKSSRCISYVTFHTAIKTT